MNFPKQRIARLAALLWPRPSSLIAAGPTGASLLILPNARPAEQDLLSRYRQASCPLRLVVIDTGGQTAECAAGFNTVTLDHLLRRIEKEVPTAENAPIYLPVSLARRWKLADGDVCGAYRVCAIPDDMGEVEPASTLNQSAPPFMLSRLKYIPRYWLGQALLFFLPLLIFGWRISLTGWGLLLLASLLLGGVWDWIPVPNLFKGPIAGLLLAGLVAIGLPALTLLSRPAAFGLGAAGFAAFAWMGFVFQGLKKG